MGKDYWHNLDPTWFNIGFISIRYYTVFFMAAIVGGYFLFRWQARRGDYPAHATRELLILSVPMTLIGARLGHCLFYQPEYYLRHPAKILLFWKGGLASHGALISMVVILILAARSFRRPALDVLDRFTFVGALGAALVRLGNFFNSEVVGRETAVPWGVRFVRYDAGSRLRHPSQLYEFVMGLVCLGILVVADRKWGGERRPVGGLSAVFLVAYFSARFLVEFTKEFQRSMGSSSLTLGQYLSIPPVLIGLWLLVRVFRERRRITGKST